MISFNMIPGNVRVPGSYIEYDPAKALSGLPAVAQKILLIGQRLGTGTTPALTPVRITSAAEAVAAKIVAQLACPYRLDGRIIGIGASVGIAVHRAGDGPQTLIERADAAMYAAKNSGGGQTVLAAGVP